MSPASKLVVVRCLCCLGTIATSESWIDNTPAAPCCFRAPQGRALPHRRAGVLAARVRAGTSDVAARCAAAATSGPAVCRGRGVRVPRARHLEYLARARALCRGGAAGCDT